MNTHTTITAYKAFDPDFSCRGFQYEVGKTYEVEGTVRACENGFHSCKNPWDTLRYYDLVNSDGSLARFARVTVSGEIDREGDKICSGRITVNAELTLPAFIEAGIKWIIDATKGVKGKLTDNSGHYAQIGSSGDSAQIGSSGDSAQIGSSGHYARIGSSGGSAQIGSSGDSAQIGSSGDYARIGSSGDSARIGSSGDYARIGSSGHYARIGSSGDSAQIGSSGGSAQIGSSGDSAQIGSSGDYARIVAEGQDAVIASAGANTTASGKDGTWISLAEFEDGKCIGFATGCIGQDGLKPDTAYRAKGGKLVEVSA